MASQLAVALSPVALADVGRRVPSSRFIPSSTVREACVLQSQQPLSGRAAQAQAAVRVGAVQAQLRRKDSEAPRFHSSRSSEDAAPKSFCNDRSPLRSLQPGHQSSRLAAQLRSRANWHVLPFQKRHSQTLHKPHGAASSLRHLSASRNAASPTPSTSSRGHGLLFNCCPRQRDELIVSAFPHSLGKGTPVSFTTCQNQRSSAARSAASPNPTPSSGGAPERKAAQAASGEPRAAPLAPPAAPAKEELNWRVLLEKPLLADEGTDFVLQQQIGGSPLGAEDELDVPVASDPGAVEQFLESRMPVHSKLHRGVLENGLRYAILPNTVPPNRFEAHLEMHVGSVDEEDNEQGLAHLVEHVTFLGSRKREKLLGTGARSNAYTDFHHTVFHVHAPCTMQGSEEPMLPMVLEALHEIAFQPRFLSSRIDKERRAVLSEAQMMNTIEYRVDCQLLQHLHSENKIGCRFPIGREEQVPKWEVEAIRAFHRRWYFPANATLYVVGDIGSVSQTIKLIEKEFGGIRPGYEDATPAAAGAQLGASAPQKGKQASSAQTSTDAAAPAVAPVRKQRHKLRPPVVHRWARAEDMGAVDVTGVGEPLPPLPGVVRPTLFQHELLQNFALTVFCKNPVRPVKHFRQLREALMGRIASYALQFRINKRYKNGEIPFMSISLDHSDSAREGCTVSTLTVVSEPQHWEGAVRLAVQEVRRLKEFGLTAGELTRYLTALMKDSEHVAAMMGTIPSLDNLDFIMENDALGHTIMDQEQAHECLTAVASTITLEDVNKVASWVLEYIADYGKPGAPQPAALVACVPATMHPLGDGEASDPASASGASVPFVITPEAIQTALTEGLSEPLIPEPEIEVPRALLSDAELAALVEKVQPRFVPLPVAKSDPGASLAYPALLMGRGSSSSNASTEGNGALVASGGGPPPEGPLVLSDADTGIILRRLGNGIRLNMKVTENEAKGGMIRLVFPGGRVEETPDLPGAVAIGVRTLSESGSVGAFSLEQVELFCLANQINCALEADEEFICMDFHFSSRHGGLRATFQLLHMVLEHSIWHEDALDRAKQLYLSHFRSLPKSLERYSAYTMLRAMFADDQRLLEPSPEAIARLSLEAVRDVVLKQLLSGHMEVSVVGDFSVAEVEQLALQYLGTVTALPQPEAVAASPIVSRPIPFVESCPLSLRRQKVFLRDTDERARAYIAGAAPNRWGFTVDGRDVNTLMEPVPLSFSDPSASIRSSSSKAESTNVLGRLIKGFFGGSEKAEGSNGASNRNSGQEASSALALDGARVEQAKAMAPLGVSVVEGSDGRLYWRKRRHPLFAATGMMLLTEIINARLFTTVRDALGLTYDVTFEISTFDRMPMGWFVISVTSTPDKIAQAVDASINVLQGIQANRITQRELDRAKRTLLIRHESDLKDNGYWLGLLTHVQCDAVPRKDVSCIRDLPTLYEVLTVEDVYAVYEQLLVDDKALFSCIGVAGTAGGPVPAVEATLEPTDVYPAGQLAFGRGTSMMTRPTE